MYLQSRGRPRREHGSSWDVSVSPGAVAHHVCTFAEAERAIDLNRSMSTLTHLQRLEAESIHIMRKVVAETERPVMLYSIGKDSTAMPHLARKAFYPAPLPFPLLHVDTTWKFRDMYAMRERVAAERAVRMLVYQNPEARAENVNPFDHGSQVHTDRWKTQGLKMALTRHGFDPAFGGARRDEEEPRQGTSDLVAQRQSPMGPENPAA